MRLNQYHTCSHVPHCQTQVFPTCFTKVYRYSPPLLSPLPSPLSPLPSPLSPLPSLLSPLPSPLSPAFHLYLTNRLNKCQPVTNEAIIRVTQHCIKLEGQYPSTSPFFLLLSSFFFPLLSFILPFLFPPSSILMFDGSAKARGTLRVGTIRFS